MHKSLVAAAFSFCLVSVSLASTPYHIVRGIHSDSDPTCSQPPTFVEVTTTDQSSCEATGGDSRCWPLDGGGYTKTICTTDDPVSAVKMNPSEVASYELFTGGPVCSVVAPFRLIGKIGACSKDLNREGYAKWTCDALFHCEDSACTKCTKDIPDFVINKGQCIGNKRFNCTTGSAPGSRTDDSTNSGNGGKSGATGGVGNSDDSRDSPSPSGAFSSYGVAVSVLLAVAVANALVLL